MADQRGKLGGGDPKNAVKLSSIKSVGVVVVVASVLGCRPVLHFCANFGNLE